MVSLISHRLQSGVVCVSRVVRLTWLNYNRYRSFDKAGTRKKRAFFWSRHGPSTAARITLEVFISTRVPSRNSAMVAPLQPVSRCPLCRQPANPCGVVQVASDKLTVFQCATCEEPGKVLGVEVPVAVTWAVDRTGRAFQHRGGEWTEIKSP